MFFPWPPKHGHVQQALYNEAHIVFFGHFVFQFKLQKQQAYQVRLVAFLLACLSHPDIQHIPISPKTNNFLKQKIYQTVLSLVAIVLISVFAASTVMRSIVTFWICLSSCGQTLRYQQHFQAVKSQGAFRCETRAYVQKLLRGSTQDWSYSILLKNKYTHM